MLAGRVVDAIVNGGPLGAVVGLAVLTAAIAVTEAGVGSSTAPLRRRRRAIRIGGVDVRRLSFDTIRATLGLVTQDGHLFHEAIRSNLLLARPEADEPQLWDVLRRARLADMIASLPDGLETVVGERGYRLSGGERQRLAIARTLLARPRVVLARRVGAAAATHGRRR